MVLSVSIVAAITDGHWLGQLAVFWGVFVYDYLITEPPFGFSFTLGFPITLSLMLLVTLVTSSITARIQRRATIKKTKNRKAELLYKVNRKLLSSRSVDIIAHHTMAYLKNDLHCSVVLYTSFDNQAQLGYYIVSDKNHANVTFFFSETEQNAVFQALRVQALTLQQQEALIMVETGKNRNSFLRSISHHSRTAPAAASAPAQPFLTTTASCPLPPSYIWWRVFKAMPNGS